MYNKGSEWRKWDLHVHTPESIEHNYKAKSGKDKWETYISDLESLPEEVKVIGINDYLFIDGYRKVLDYKKEGRLKNIDLILPVIELRLSHFCGNKQFKRINYHVIFSDELSPELIETQFLNRLSANYRLSPGINSDKSWNGVVTRDSLTDLGRQIIDSAPDEEKAKYGSPLKEGFNNLNLNLEVIEDALKSSYLKGKFLTAIGKTEWDELQWGDSSIAEKKTIINGVDFVFTAAECVEKFNKGKERLITQGVNNRLLDCSDAHNNIDCGNSKDRLGNCFTWIKADPTFEGLRQVVAEFSERVFVGGRPHSLVKVENNKTKYIRRLEVSSNRNYEEGEKGWFNDVGIDFNKELVAIIGNKGNGKSAIADIVAHCCDVQQQDYFSFLHQKKFRRGGLANNFRAKIIFEDGTELSKDSLGELKNTENGEPYVKYLPQGYFESICNDLQKEDDLKKEIENVVFQYLDEAERLGSSNFQELIEKKVAQTEEEINELKGKLSSVNNAIIALEKKENPKYVERIASDISKREAEIRALPEPVTVLEPDIDSHENQLVIQEINRLKSEISGLEKNIGEKREEKRTRTEKITTLESLVAKMHALKRRVDEAKSEVRESVERCGLNVDSLVEFSINVSPVEELLSKEKEELRKLSPTISENMEGNENLFYRKNALEKRLEEKQALLNGPVLKYQQYLRLKEEFIKKKSIIEGSETIPNSLRWLKHEKLYVDTKLASEIKEKSKIRLEIAKDIYRKKQQILDVYKKAKERIDTKIEENRALLGCYDVKVEAHLFIDNNFCDNFLHYILQNMKGSFKGKAEGASLIKKTITEYDIQSIDGLSEFCERLTELLKKDVQKNEERRFVEEQVANVHDLYDYVYSLDYLKHNYQLKQGDKELSLLSPGEKGALLLVFYLLLDMDDKPLILDQPEDNLDNNSVANILVDFIKKAKKKRQIIMVTHNPNLAIVSDAEQIIYAQIEKDNNYKFSVESGSIENPKMNKRIVDVLEGAMPAFRKRDNKYIWDRED